MLFTKENGAYTFDASKSYTHCKQNVNTDKNSKDKNSYNSKTRKNSFHNFNERECSDEEIQELERRLLGKVWYHLTML